jgi:plasmid stabilization system protein ParE
VKFRVLSAAQIEATESALWYEDQQPGLADNFFVELDKGYERIRENPAALSRLEYYSGPHEIRRCLLARFPYAVIFLVNGDEVVVVAIAHTRRRPLYWLSRL